MAILHIFLLQILLFHLRSNGLRIRTQCSNSAAYRCESVGTCIDKNQWCDGSHNCEDSSDELYCSLHSSGRDCDPFIHFRCEDDDRCIPIEGYCDGFTSCLDESDELDCPCDQIYDNEGFIQFEAFIGNYRTQHKCWELVAENGQHVEVRVRANLFDRDCENGRILLYPQKPLKSIFRKRSEEICASDRSEKVFHFTESVKIRYRSSYLNSYNDPVDFFNITYLKEDPDCLLAQAFRCSPNSCIKPEEQCNGKIDCENGLDEQNCEFSAFSTSYLKSSRQNAIRWLLDQRDSDWGWKANTAKAVVALGLDGAFAEQEFKDDLTAKQLELEVFTLLLRSEEESVSPAELSTYINALILICHDPKNFYGFDLVRKLREEMENISPPGLPLSYLTLCSAMGDITETDVKRLLQMLQTSTTNGGFVFEVQALTLIALSCISRNNQFAHLKQNITEHVNALKKEQKEDGSFGNEYTTALVLQALTANNQTNDKDWNFKNSIEFLRRNQRSDGSFGDFLSTYLVMPILNAKSLLDVGMVNCTEKRPRESTVVSDIRSRLGDKIPVKYSLFIGDEKDQIHPIVLRTPKNVTVLELMALAADIDPKYKFKTHEIRKRSYVYEIFNIPNDPESNKFWFIYVIAGNTTGASLAPTQCPGEIRVTENESIIMWYKTLHTV